MNFKTQVIPILIEFPQGVTLTFNIPRRTTVKKLVTVLTSYVRRNFQENKNQEKHLEISGIVTKAGDHQADYWLQNWENDFEVFKKNTAFEVIYKQKDFKVFKT